MSEAMTIGEVEPMDVSAIVPYFGSKRTLAPRIVAEFGDHTQFFEVFCGSCAVLLAKPPARMEYVNDMNGELVNLIRVIQHPVLGPKLYRQCRRTIMCEQLFRDAANRWKERDTARRDRPAPEQDQEQEPDLDAVVDYFYTSWVGRNGVVGTQSYNQGFAARYTSRGGHAGTRWVSSVDSIPKWRRRMRSVVVLNRDAFGLIAKIEDEASTVIYADPPYLVKGAKYRHDFEKQDHARLAGLLARFQHARVVVSYYRHPELARMYPTPQWTTIDCPVKKSMLSGNGRKGESSGPVTAPEVLIVNGPSYVDPAKGGLFGGGA